MTDDKTRAEFYEWWDLEQDSEVAPIDIWQAAKELYAPRAALPQKQEAVDAVIGDAFKYGTGIMQGGKHVSHDDFYSPPSTAQEGFKKVECRGHKEYVEAQSTAQGVVYVCHQCNQQVPPPKNFSLYVYCKDCDTTTAVTIAADLASQPTAQDGMVKDAARWNFLKGKFGFNQHGIYLPCGRVTEQDRAQMAVDTDIAVDKAMLKAARKGE